jgi:hypothetical protein
MAPTWEKPRRVEMGFQGGQDLTLRLAQDAYEGLSRALEAGATRWHTVQSEDSQVAIDLTQVVYVRLDTEQHRVGFGSI